MSCLLPITTSQSLRSVCFARNHAPIPITRRQSRSRWHTPGKAVHSTFEQRQQRRCVCSYSQFSQILTATQATVPILLATTLAAVADEDPTVDAAFAAAAQSTGATDLLVSVLAALVFGLLVVVTGGVAYLNIKSFLDDRQEKQDQKAPAASSVPASSSSSGSDSEDSGPRRVRITRDKSRGFGNN